MKNNRRFSDSKSPACCSCCSLNRALIIISAICFVLVLLSGVVIVLWPSIVNSLLRKVLVIQEGSMSYPTWIEFPVPIYFSVYFFNTTNPDEVALGGKPNLTELGPYVFIERIKKQDIEFTEDYTVKYNMTKTYVFQPHLTKGTLDDNVTSIDLMAYTATYRARNRAALKYVLSKALIMKSYKTFSTRKVRELLFEGYSDSLLSMASMLNLPVPADKLGFFYNKNGSATHEGRFEINTGVDDISKLGQIVSWNNKTEFDIYQGECSVIKGSPEVNPPKKKREDDVLLFRTPACRALKLTYKEDTSLYGLPGYRYWSDKMTFANSTTRPDNKCFEDEDDTLYPDGVMDVSKCSGGTPLLLSLPHFLNGDPSLLDDVQGLNPTEDVHQIFADVNPLTSKGFRFQANTQLNLALQPIRGIRMFSKVPKVAFPIFWMARKGELTPELIGKLKKIENVTTYGRILFIVLLSVSFIVLAVCSILFVYRLKKNKNILMGNGHSEADHVLK